MNAKSTSNCIQTPRKGKVHLEGSTTASTSVLLQDRLVSSPTISGSLHSATAFNVPERPERGTKGTNGPAEGGETRLDWLFYLPLAHIRESGKHLAGGVIGSSNLLVQSGVQWCALVYDLCAFGVHVSVQVPRYSTFSG